MSYKFYQAKCKKCNDSRYFYPEGKPDLSAPCDKCNPNGESPADETKRIPYGSDIFRFGVHQGKTYNEVPDRFFIWAIDQRWIDDWPQVRNYIERNFKDEIS